MKITKYSIAILSLLLFLGGCKRPSKKIYRVFSKAQLSSPKKRILICNCGGGGAHLSATKAIRSALGDTYDLAEVYMLNDVLDELDFVRSLTFHQYKGEDLYNFFLRNGSIWFANMLCNFGRMGFKKNNATIRAAIKEFVLENKPDLILSVMPFIDGPLADVSEELNIPLIVIPCDFEAMNYIIKLDAVTNPKFKFGLVLDDPLVRDTIAPAKIPEKNLIITGFPLRSEFLRQRTEEEKQAIRKSFAVYGDKPVIMILMGGNGSSAVLQYVRKIARNNVDCHMLVCIGRNERLYHKISRIKLGEKTMMSVIGFTDKIADLMSISDLLITKPGPATIAEALYLNLPMLLDASNKVLFWERLNIDLVRKNNFGEVVTKTGFKKLDKILDHFLEDKQYYSTIKNNLIQYKKENFSENIKKIVKEALKV